MQSLEVSVAVRPIYGLLGVKRLRRSLKGTSATGCDRLCLNSVLDLINLELYGVQTRTAPPPQIMLVL
jgi:hypothetical protein